MAPLHTRALCLALVLGLTACLPEPPGVDLDGPRIVASTLPGPRSVEIPVLPELIVEFSEPLDPATVHSGSVALVAWKLLDERCELSPICDEGSCERGRCQAEALPSSQRNALERGEFDASRGLAIELELSSGVAGPDTRLTIRPHVTLDEHRRHSLLIGAIRDRSGAPLVDDHDRAVAWQRDFVTAGIGSAGPQPRLVTPAPGQQRVPTNLAWVETELWPPVPVIEAATLELEADDGGAPIVLTAPRDCPGWVPGTCLRWRPSTELRPGVRWRPLGGTLLDRFGRGVVGPAITTETWFRSDSGPDLEPPRAELIAWPRGRCLAVWIDAGEPVEAVLSIGAIQHRAAIDHTGFIGVELDDVTVGESLDIHVELRDFADNASNHTLAFEPGPSFDPQLPRVRLTEILANPTGPEPDGEFIELQAGPIGATLDAAILSDATFAEILEAWQQGDDPPGDPLPTIELEPDQLLVLVGHRWTTAEWADALPSGAAVLELDASLGRSGLKNAGEPLSLWTMTEHGPVLLAGYGNWIDTSAKAHDGRSVVAAADGCDLPDRWRSHPLGTASPGALP